MEYLILVLALAGIVFGADTLVAGSVAVARRYKVSDFVIGAAIVGIGTSMPELTVSFLGALQGNAEVNKVLIAIHCHLTNQTSDPVFSFNTSFVL